MDDDFRCLNIYLFVLLVLSKHCRPPVIYFQRQSRYLSVSLFGVCHFFLLPLEDQLFEMLHVLFCTNLCYLIARFLLELLDGKYAELKALP